MKKIVLSFIIPLAVFSLAVFVAVPVPAEAQVVCPVGYTCTPVDTNTPLITVPSPNDGENYPSTSVCYNFTANLQLGSRGEDVTALQNFLLNKGFKIGDLSPGRGSDKGYFGGSTFQALMKYQKSVGIEATGYFGPETRQKVSKDCSGTKPMSPTTITIMNPQAGEILQKGFSYKIVWTSNSILNNNEIFDITQFTDYGKSLIAEGVTTAQASCYGVTDGNGTDGGPFYTCAIGWTPQYASTKAQLVVEKRGTNDVGYSGSFTIASCVSGSDSCDKPELPRNECSVSAITAPEQSSRVSPKLFNIDFGNWTTTPSSKTGPAVVGNQGDFWNVVAVSYCDLHNKSNLKNADGTASQIVATLQNLGGGWGDNGMLGLADPMLANFNYPAANRGGNAMVSLSNIPKGSYDLYIYNKTGNAAQNGDYAVSTADGADYGRKAMTTDVDSYKATSWQENNQFVVFKDIKVSRLGTINITIYPSVGGLRDAQIAGLQLAPAGTSPAVKYTQYESSSDQSSPAGAMRVLSPNGGEIWQQGTRQTIKWDGKRSSSSKVDLYADLAYPSNIVCIKSPCVASSALIAGGVSNIGRYQWSVGNADAKGGLANGAYYIRVCDANNQYKCDSSDSTFNLVSPSGSIDNQSIVVTMPSNGSVFDNGLDQNIIVGWNTYPGDFEYYRVYVGNEIANVSGMVSGPISKYSNGYAMTAGAVRGLVEKLSGKVAPNTGYYVIVHAIKNDRVGEGSVASGRSSGSFSIFAPTTQPAMTATITSGTDASTLTPTITGTASGVSQVGIVLSNSGGKVYASGLIPVTSGRWSVTVSPGVAAGLYDVMVYDANNNKLTSGTLTVSSSVVIPVVYPGAVKVVARINGRILTSTEAKGCISTITGPSGSNTSGCVRSLTNQPAGTYTVKWESGYPTGADTTKAPTVSPVRFLGDRPAGENPVTFYVDFAATPVAQPTLGIAFVSANTSVSSGTQSNDDVGTFQIKYKIAAVGGDIYIPSNITSALNYVVDRAGVPVNSSVISATLTNDTDSTVTTMGNYVVEDGTQEIFTLTVTMRLGGTYTAGQYRTSLTGIKWGAADDTTPEHTYTNLDGFKTSYVGLNLEDIQNPANKSAFTASLLDALKGYIFGR